MKTILFITSNDDKFREFQEILVAAKLKREKLELPELQGAPDQIVKEKARLACKITGKPCFVDDTSLCFDAWKELPGPYIKDFLKNIGVENLPPILIKSSDNHNARAITSIGYCEPGKEPICIQGITKGKITLARGNKNFRKGWDQIFIPDGSTKTYAEMDSHEKHSFSQ